jgi:glucans biosynthesis protein
MHGGALGSGAPIGNRNALKHGFWTAAAIAERRTAAALLSDIRETLRALGQAHDRQA